MSLSHCKGLCGSVLLHLLLSLAFLFSCASSMDEDEVPTFKPVTIDEPLHVVHSQADAGNRRDATIALDAGMDASIY